MTDRIVITLGDPAGIGPEVALKALGRLSAAERKKVLLLGPGRLYSAISDKLSIKTDFQYFFTEPGPSKYSLGRPQPALTRMAVASIDLAVRLAMQNKVSAIVTAPINKAGLKEAGFRMPGHTEYLAELSGTKKFDMMLVGGPLRTVLVTRHVALKDVPRKISRTRCGRVGLPIFFQVSRFVRSITGLG